MESGPHTTAAMGRATDEASTTVVPPDVLVALHAAAARQRASAAQVPVGQRLQDVLDGTADPEVQVRADAIAEAAMAPIMASVVRVVEATAPIVNFVETQRRFLNYARRTVAARRRDQCAGRRSRPLARARGAGRPRAAASRQGDSGDDAGGTSDSDNEPALGGLEAIPFT